MDDLMAALAQASFSDLLWSHEPLDLGPTALLLGEGGVIFPTPRTTPYLDGVWLCVAWLRSLAVARMSTSLASQSASSPSWSHQSG